jgi:hypothetical protein
MSEDMFAKGRDGFTPAVVLRDAATALRSKHESQETFLLSMLMLG